MADEEEINEEDPKPEKHRDNTVFLLIVIMFLIVGMVVLWVVKDSEIYRTLVPVCTSDLVAIDLSEPEVPSIFSDLTQKEMNNAIQLIRGQTGLHLVNGSDVTLASTYIFSLEVLMPKKTVALGFLDKKKIKPGRFAKAVIFRGDVQNPKVEEYVVGPLLSTSNSSAVSVVTLTKTIPWAFRPLSSIELNALQTIILPKLDNEAESVLMESFGGKFFNCSKRCLTYYYSPVSTSNYNRETRTLWLHFTHSVEYHTLHPLEFHILMNLDGTDPSKFSIQEISYYKQTFYSLKELVTKFDQGSIKKIHIQFPEVSEELFSTVNLRGNPSPIDPSRRPFQLEPDGKRYMISGQKIQFMEWGFHYRMSTNTGPMIFDVNYRRERIIYEISLQEIAVLSLGKVPIKQNNNFETSSGVLGTASRGLVPGADCPEHATFLASRHLVEGSSKSTLYQNALCIFEQETSVPLRRHHSYSKNAGRFYAGMLDDVLVLRTVLSICNYDYLVDFIFHLNGVLEVKVAYTGFILAKYSYKNGKQIGYALHDNIAGDIYYFALNFKVDIDVKGKQNSFEALEPTKINSSKVEFNNVVKFSEKLASYHLNSEMPKYMLFYNERSKNKYDTARAYRLHVSESGKMALPDDIGNKHSVSWINYRLAITRYKESESKSSSAYSTWDGTKPVVKFASFLQDNEDVKNQDLVAWVTLGTYHLPHAEDLPTMATPGAHLGFTLLPHNYFREDPSMSSRNAIRVDMTRKTDATKDAVRVERYSVPNDVRCVGNATDFYDLVAEDSKLLFVGDES